MSCLSNMSLCRHPCKVSSSILLWWSWLNSSCIKGSCFGSSISRVLNFISRHQDNSKEMEFKHGFILQNNMFFIQRSWIQHFQYSVLFYMLKVFALHLEVLNRLEKINKETNKSPIKQLDFEWTKSNLHLPGVSCILLHSYRHFIQGQVVHLNKNKHVLQIFNSWKIFFLQRTKQICSSWCSEQD